MKRLLLALCLAAPAAQAANFTVTRFDDPVPDGCTPTDCSLREAIAAANIVSGTDTVVLGTGTHVLQPQGAASAVTLEVTSALVLRGAGRDATVVSGPGGGTLFAIGAVSATFRGLTLRDGVSTAALEGSAIRAAGSTLWLDDVRLVANRASEGGALHLVDTPAELAATLVESNSAADRGGAVHANNSPLRLRRGTVMSGNETGGYGGAVYTDDQIIADDDCAISANAAHYGGGIAGPYTAPLYVRGVKTTGGDGLFEIGGNVATGKEPMWQVPDGAGGGLYSSGGMYLERVAVRDNRTNQRAGGIASSHGKLTMKDSVVSGNHAAMFGGGISHAFADLVLERVSLHDNDAGTHSGALHINHTTQLPPISATLWNVNLHDNTAPSRAAISNAAILTIVHGTFWNNLSDTGRDAIAQQDAGSVNYRNSLLSGRCTTTGPSITSVAGNLRSNEAANACPGTTINYILPLSRGRFGGLFEVIGSTSATGLANAGNPNYCRAEDVRNRARGATCDVGAFEYGAQ